MDNIIIKAMTDIDERFILEAADEGHIREVFLNLTEEDGFTADDFVNTGEVEETDSDTTAEENQPKRKSTKRTHKVSFKKILLVAVISVLIASLVIFAAAKLNIIELNPEIYEFFDSFIRINRDKLDSTPDNYSIESSEIVAMLKDKGVPNIILPSAILGDEWEVTDIRLQEPEEGFEFPFVSCDINLKTDKGTCFCNIWYINIGDLEMDNDDTDLMNVVRVDEINIDNLTVTVAQHISNSITFTYFDTSNGKTEYHISLKGFTYEEALEIAKTIG